MKVGRPRSEARRWRRRLYGELRIALQRDRPPAVSIFPMGPTSPPGRVLSALAEPRWSTGRWSAKPPQTSCPSGTCFRLYEVDRPRALDALFGILPEARSARSRPPLQRAVSGPRSGLPLLPLQVADFARERPSKIASDPPFNGLAVTQPLEARGRAGGHSVRGRAADRRSNTLVRTAAAGAPRTPTSMASSIRSPTTARARDAAPSSWAPGEPREPSSWPRGGWATRSPSPRGVMPRRTGWRKR